MWAAVLDFKSRQQHSSRVKNVEYLDGTPLREGSRVSLTIDRNTFTVNVEGIRPPEQLATVVKGPGFRAHHTYDVEASGETSRATITASYEGLHGRVF